MSVRESAELGIEALPAEVLDTLNIADGGGGRLMGGVRISGIEGLRLDTTAGLSVGATSTASMAVRLVLPQAWAQRHSGETLPVVFQIDPDTAGTHASVAVKSTFLVPRY